jgi:hypothetical protein
LIEEEPKSSPRKPSSNSVSGMLRWVISDEVIT